MNYVGQLKQSITFQTVTRGVDASGGVTTLPVSYATRWAYLRPLRGREFEHANKTEAQTVYRATCRVDSDTDSITGANRFLYGTRAFEILSVRNLDESWQWLEVDAIEETA